MRLSLVKVATCRLGGLLRSTVVYLYDNEQTVEFINPSLVFDIRRLKRVLDGAAWHRSAGRRYMLLVSGSCT